jgi:hypothetical protein
MCENRPIETLPAMAAQAPTDPFSPILAGKARRPLRTPAGSAAARCWAASGMTRQRARLARTKTLFSCSLTASFRCLKE